MWSTLQQSGPKADSRQGATACIVGDYLYIYGGFSSELFNGFKCYDLQNMRWKEMDESNHTPWPRARFAHSMISYRNKLYVFGGAGPYIK